MRRIDLVLVQLRTKVPGSAGQNEWEPSGDPIEVRGNMHPLSADEIVFWGDHGREMQKFACDTWPGDMQSVMTWDGSEWDQVAPEQRARLGRGTKHVEVVLRRR
jgi:hypothetical protein